MKNCGLTPIDVMPNSDKKVWWKCNKGHEWQARIANRNKGSGCPVCISEQHTSFPEYAIVYYLKKYGLEAIHSYNEHGYELDIYIPHKKIAIEYDGYYWHKNKVQQDLSKNQKCAKDGIKLYRIRAGLPPLNDSSIDYLAQENQKDLSTIICKLLSEIIGTIVDVDLIRDSIAIENLRNYTEKECSLLVSNPQLAREWNYEKNGNLKPENITANSGKKVWWICEKGHEWQTPIYSRSNGNGCPYCSGRKILTGFNDLQTINPTLASEWFFEKNGELKPELIAANSGIKVWWRCQRGHEWQATIASRNTGVGCPYCVGKKVSNGFNDLQSLNPSLAEEWNYDKNINLSPEKFTANSSKKVWWKCEKGHEWQATIANRNMGKNCPYCSGRYAVKGENDLQTVNPTLANEWNYEKNGELKPDCCTANSNKKVWWKCEKGHEWAATIANRNKGHGCPQCANLRRKS